MNVGTLKTLSYLSSIGLLGGIGYVGYDHYTTGQHVQYYDGKATKDMLDDIGPPPTPKRLGLNYNEDIQPSIVAFDWTGAPPPEPEINQTEDLPVDVVKVTPVSELIDVKSIFCAPSDPDDSLCLLTLKQPATGEDFWFGIGDTLPAPNDNVAIFAIDPNTVVFSFEDAERENEAVEPSSVEDDYDKKFITSVADASQIKKPNGLRNITKGERAQARRTTERIKGQVYIGTEDAANFSANYQQILSNEVKVETYMKDGKRAGLKIREVQAGSMAARHGVQAEDVIISINNTPVTSKQEGIQYVQQNSENTNIWRVKLLRNGREIEEVYHSPEED